MSIAELLAAIRAKFTATPAQAPMLTKPPAKHGVRATRAPLVSRFVRMCPGCAQPIRRRLRDGTRTDRFFDKSMGAVVCTACAPARVKP